jgi:hypothetical protein
MGGCAVLVTIGHLAAPRNSPTGFAIINPASHFLMIDNDDKNDKFSWALC